MNPTIADALRDAVKLLKSNDARRDANLMLGAVLEKDLTFLIAHSDAVLTDAEQANFFEFVERRAKGEPVQYILGRQEFYGLDFEVSPTVLIPRPETEILLEAALEVLHKAEIKTFCDVGTGSGCLAVTIAKNLPDAHGFALDISPQALEIARRNAEKHAVSRQIVFYESDVFEIFRNPQSAIRNPQFQIIVSNPPYIPESDLPTLQREVREHEPHNALFSGADGFDVVRKLLRDAPRFLTEDGFLLFEIGFDQSAAVRQIVDADVWRLIEFRRDLQNIPRIVVLQKKC